MNLTNPFHPGAGIIVWAVNVLWGVTILLGAVATLAATAGRNRPTVRHGLWLGALICVLALPALTGLLDGLDWRIASMRIALPAGLFAAHSAPGPGWVLGPRESPSGAEGAMAAARAETGPVVPIPNREQSAALQERGAEGPTSYLAGRFAPRPGRADGRMLLLLAASAWVVGSLLLALRLVVGWRRLRRLARDAQAPPPDWRLAELQGVRRALSLSNLPPIALCRGARVPMVVGLVHPRVVLPKALAAEMSASELTQTLIHECAHVRRGDPWVLAVQRLALVVFWPHPLLHYLNRELERAREELCDNHVLAASRPAAYAETLLRLAQACLPAPEWGAGMAMLRRGTHLEQRIRRLVNKHRERDLVLARWPRLGVALLMALLAAGLSAVQVQLGAAQNQAAQGPAAGAPPLAEVEPGAHPGNQEPTGEIELKVAELTRDWGRMKLFEDADTWGKQIRELVQIGGPAVPALVALLDRTDADLSLRLIGFSLRAIGDPRAVPALIRAIPKTLRPPGSDCGVRFNDIELRDCLAQYHLSAPKPDQRGAIDLGRPVREICTALQKISGATWGEEDLFHTFLEGGSHQRDLKRQLYDRVARRWADWWEANWNRFAADPALAAVRLPPLTLSGQAGLGRFPTGPNVKVTEGAANVPLGPVEKQGAGCFLDLDTGRQPGWPEALGDWSQKGASLEALWVWASQEGMDLAGMTYRTPGSEMDYYYLRGVGLQAWEIPNERWDRIAEEVRQDRPLELGRPAGDTLMHYDSQQGGYIPNRRATFLFITREGTPGILRLSTQVFAPGSHPAPAVASTAQSDPVLRLRKALRIAPDRQGIGDRPGRGGGEAAPTHWPQDRIQALFQRRRERIQTGRSSGQPPRRGHSRGRRDRPRATRHLEV